MSFQLQPGDRVAIQVTSGCVAHGTVVDVAVNGRTRLAVAWDGVKPHDSTKGPRIHIDYIQNGCVQGKQLVWLNRSCPESSLVAWGAHLLEEDTP